MSVVYLGTSLFAANVLRALADGPHRPALVVNGSSTLRGKGMRYDNRTRQLTVTAASDVKISGEDQAARNAGSKKNERP